MEIKTFQNFRILKANESDARDIVAVMLKTVETCYVPVYPKEAIDYFKEHHKIEHIIEKIKDSSYLVAKEEDKIIGTGFLKDEYIGGVYILPIYQGCGIGRKMMEALLHQAKENKQKKVHLHASIPSKHFYDSMGFITSEEVKMPLPNDKFLLHWNMERKIN